MKRCLLSLDASSRSFQFVPMFYPDFNTGLKKKVDKVYVPGFLAADTAQSEQILGKSFTRIISPLPKG
jgi:hypothetical protein